MEPSVLGERVLSAIVEFRCLNENIEAVLEALKKVAGEIDTVFSLGLISLVDKSDDSIYARKIIDKLNINVNKTSAKTNLGLGRPSYEERMRGAGQ